MQTNINNKFKNNPAIDDAENILRSCVHCGFCTATCPTYQLLGDELDGPRGRIYLIKQVLEGKEVTQKTQLHLDRCLTCRSCETTCPSGVRYGRLIDIGRDIVDEQVPRSFRQNTLRYLLRKIVPYPSRFKRLAKIGKLVKPVLPSDLQKKIPDVVETQQVKAKTQARKMLVLEGCVQSVSTPATNQAAKKILERFDIELVSANNAGCCGAVSFHLSAHDESLQFMKNNIDAWWPYVEKGIEAIVVTASGCGVVVKDYGEILKNDSDYAEKAEKVSKLAKDFSEIVLSLDFSSVALKPTNQKVAFHSPCTLQHGQKINGVVEKILEKSGYTLVNVNDSHLCCGSAGTYSILQSELSQQLLSNKLYALQEDNPAVIATANIGCQMHMATSADVPVKHWVELLEQVVCH